jgi:hypothetical protein
MKMIDYLKIEIKSLSVAENLIKNKLLDFESTVNNNTGEVKRQKSVFQGLTFFVYPNGKILIEGSLHKFRNKGIHNFDDFSFFEVCQTINRISKMFGFEASKATLHGLEFGVNIRVNQNPTNVLKMIICYGKDAIQKMDISAKAEGLKSVQTNYVVKIYNKSMQYRPENLDDILRVEQKILRMRQLRNLEICTLKDLTDYFKIKRLGGILFSMFKELIIYEPLDVSALSKSELKLYEKSENPRFWEQLSRRMRTHNKQQFEKMIDKHSKQRLKENITNLINSKWTELLNAKPLREHSCNVFTNNLEFKNVTFSPTFCPPPKVRNVTFSQVV